MADDGEHKRRKLAENVMVSRSIAACQRCRLKKIKCDQSYPKCTKCAKAGLECVGIDPATGREVPRLYVHHLEEKVLFLEEKLKMHGIDADVDNPTTSVEMKGIPILPSSVSVESRADYSGSDFPGSDLGSRSLPSANSAGISFARLMTTAVKMHALPLRLDPLELTLVPPTTAPPAVLPPVATAQEFIRIYFAQSNTQLPLLHRETFLRTVFEPVYGAWDERVPLARYSAPPCHVPEEETWFRQYQRILAKRLAEGGDATAVSSGIVAPAQFHRPLFVLNIVFALAASVNHLQYPSSISDQFNMAALKYIDSTYSAADPLDLLEAVLLLTVFSLMRPLVPGVWYVLGTALRTCVDLRLHKEDLRNKFDAYTKDRRRRLFWSTYLLDRQISFYLDRPLGIPEENITSRFPSTLDDAFIVEDANTDDFSEVSGLPSYKAVVIASFEIRIIQLEVLRVLHLNAELPRRFDNLHHWREHIVHRLEQWHELAPRTQQEMDCDFNTEYFTLNYNHTLLLIYGLSPKTFKLLRSAYRIVADALKNLIACYTKLHAQKAINYTWAAVHNLFMAGTSFLFAVYNSPEVRARYEVAAVKDITQECHTVLLLLIASCDAAKSCADSFALLTAAVLQLRYNEVVDTTNLGPVEPPRAVKLLLEHRTNGNLANLVEGLAKESPEDFPAFLPRSHWEGKSSLSGSDTPSDYNGTDRNTGTENGSGSNGENGNSGANNGNSSANNGNSHNGGHRGNINGGDERDDINDLGTPFGGALDDFFTEVAALSPVSSVREPMDSGFSLLDDSTPKVPAKDGERVFELLQLVPTESIWDQFFAVPNTLSLVKEDMLKVEDLVN